MKIDSDAFRVRPGKKLDLRKWPTAVEPVYRSGRDYRMLFEHHVEQLAALQKLHYACRRYALLNTWRHTRNVSERAVHAILPGMQCLPTTNVMPG